MTQHVVIGDPAASSLSSCLCAFPGGFSLLTETGRLRPFLISCTDRRDHDDSAGSTAAVHDVVAADPVQLSAPSSPGSFPAGGDVPVDHTWSHDGNVLVVLRRLSFTVYWRDSMTDAGNALQGAVESPPPENFGRDDGESCSRRSCRRSENENGRSFDLVELRTVRNGFEGRVVACCALHAASGQSRGNAGHECRQSYMIAVGGTFGVECHTVDSPVLPNLANSDADHDSSRLETFKGGGATVTQHEPKQSQLHTPASMVDRRTRTPRTSAAAEVVDKTKFTAFYRPIGSIFRGYPVVALAISPDSSLMAAAAMTGHVKVWDVLSVVESPPPPPRPRARKVSAGTRRGRSKKKVPDDAASEEQPSRQRDDSECAAVWATTLSMARATSISFSPDDSGIFAIACWDGAVSVFLPEAFTPDRTSADVTARSHARRKSGGDARNSFDGDGRGRLWKQVWRETAAPLTTGGKKAPSLEDQDGVFLSWCKAPGLGFPADLCVSAYDVMSGACLRHGHRNGSAASSDKIDKGKEERLVQDADAHAQKGAGFEVFAEGLGDRVGGAILQFGQASKMEPTAERYSIHGLATGPSFVVLYDSEWCLRVASNAPLYEAGRVLPPVPRESNDKTVLTIEELRLQATSMAVTDAVNSYLIHEDSTATETSSPKAEGVTLVNNDHGLIVARVHPRHGLVVHEEDDGALALSVTWRNAVTGAESLDDGDCTGGSDRRLSFAPSGLASDCETCDGVFGADVRWNCFAIFFKYKTLVWSRALGKGLSSGESNGGADDASVEGRGWTTYPHRAILDGALIGGASTSSPLSKDLPKAPPDLEGLFILEVLETDEDDGDLAVAVRPVLDRDITCRCSLRSADDGVQRADLEIRRTKVLASPNYGGGNFVVAAEGRKEECATIWRGKFDEACHLAVESPRVLTAHPGLEPVTLRLEGVAGPNCELIMFKECAKTEADVNRNSDEIRWWITWPEFEVWEYIDAPATLGGQALGIADIVKIFQLDVEAIMASHSQADVGAL